MNERPHDDMAKQRPSLFAPKPEPAAVDRDDDQAATSAAPSPIQASVKRPPSREGKRVLSVYLDPLAWKQLRQLALDTETSTQALGAEAVNLLFAKHGINRSA
jgi:hypothetical protein